MNSIQQQQKANFQTQPPLIGNKDKETPNFIKSQMTGQTYIEKLRNQQALANGLEISQLNLPDSNQINSSLMFAGEDPSTMMQTE